MGIVVLPPRTVERGTKGEVSVPGVVLYSHIGYGAPTVIARHIDTVEQQVGLYRQELTTQQGVGSERRGGDGWFYWGYRGDSRQSGYGVYRDDRLFLYGFYLLQVDDETGSTQLGEVLLQQSCPQLSAIRLLQLILQKVILLMWQVQVA